MKNIFLVFSFVLCTFFSSLVLAQTTAKVDGSDASYAAKINGTSVANRQTILSSAFNPKSFQWDIAWPGRVSQYDLVYKSPPINPMQGIPLGNGDIGVLFWCEDSKIIAVVNKSDLWDDAPLGPFRNWSGKEEDYSTTQRHASRIIIDFKFPVFNTLYLSDFKAKLNLADASLSLEATSPFGKVSLKAFVDQKSGVLLYDMSSDLNEEVPVEIAVERFGSRTFSHWYSQINRDASIGLSGTEVIADDKNVYITQKLSGGTFAVGGTVIQDNGLTVNYSREHSRRAAIQLSGSRQKNAELAFSVTSPVAGDPVSEVKNTLSSVRDKGIEPFRKSHAEAWKSIWNRSFMDYGDDYLNNLWYLTMYYANASQGGKYPGRFNNGLWGWSRDVQQWNFYFHWNQQQLYWPLNAAGYPELIEPYLDYRFKSLPYARQDAKEHFKVDGAFISDVTERRGYNDAEKENHTPVAEIALDFWRQYQYTGDKKFLKEKALPFIKEAAFFFVCLYAKEADGLYHAQEGTGYEGGIKLKDGLTEMVYGRVLFSTALQALKEAGADIPEAKKWKEILDNMAPIPLIKAEDSMISSEAGVFRIKSGHFKGKTVPTNMITPGGWGIKEGKWLPVWGPSEKGKSGLKWHDGIFPSVPSSTVYPSNFIGLGQKDKDSSLFQAVKSTTILYSPGSAGWDPGPIVLARMGLADELADVLSYFPERFQTYCNGWGQWGMEGEVKDAEYLIFRTAMVRDVASGSKNAEKLPLPMSPFRHMSMESMSVLATAMNESLLQNHERIIRIAPAFPTNGSCRFKLYAVGGFEVSSEVKEGIVQWISIKSQLGNICKIELPWQNAVVYSGNRKLRPSINKNVTEIKTKPGEIITILPPGASMESWIVVEEKAKENENVKYHSSGKSQLGLPRMF